MKQPKPEPISVRIKRLIEDLKASGVTPTRVTMHPSTARKLLSEFPVLEGEEKVDPTTIHGLKIIEDPECGQDSLYVDNEKEDD